MKYSLRHTYCVLFALLGVFAGPVAAQGQAAGTLTGFSFLQLEASARSSALGGAYHAVYGDDVNALFYNPALLNEDMHRGLSLTLLNHVSDVRAGFLAYSFDMLGAGSFGLGLRFLNWGDLRETDASGNDLGSFNASDLAFTAGYARPYSDRIRLGVNVHTVLSRIDSFSAFALAADAGVLYLAPGRQFTASASVHNVGATLSSLGETNDELPIDFRLSLTHRLRHLPLMLSLTGYDLHNVASDLPGETTADRIFQHVAFGGEFQFSEGFNVRFGYNHRRHEALKIKSRLDFAGFGLGVGIKLSVVRFDYAYNSWSSFGGLHYITVRTVL